METPSNQIKAMFFAQYWGQKIFFVNQDGYNNKITDVVQENLNYNLNWCVQLTPLELITDEDAIEVAKIFDIQLPIDKVYKLSNSIQVFDALEYNVCIYFDGEIEEGADQQPLTLLKAYDFLRSKGYALPWREYSVEDLVSFGWVKLKTE